MGDPQALKRDRADSEIGPALHCYLQFAVLVQKSRDVLALANDCREAFQQQSRARWERERQEVEARLNARIADADTPQSAESLRAVHKYYSESFEDLVSTTGDNAQLAARTGAVAILHNAIEVLCISLIKLFAQAVPSGFVPKIQERKIPVSRVLSRTAAEILREIIEVWIDETEKASIHEKWKRLCYLCPSIHVNLKDLAPEVEAALVDLDVARRDAIHGDGSALSKFDLQSHVVLWDDLMFRVTMAVAEYLLALRRETSGKQAEARD